MADNKINEFSHKLIRLHDLYDYFGQFAKVKEDHRFGLECEVFGLDEKTARPIPYFGSRGIEGVLDGLVEDFGWQRLRENTRVIALERGDDSITLEPGGQLELSAAPVRTLAEVDRQIKLFRRELKQIGEKIGIRWLSMGAQPLASARQMPWVPKARYEVMRTYLAAQGHRAHDMMQRTATNQFNVDFESEADAVEKMRLIFRMAPFINTAFANSPIFDGKRSDFLSHRVFIWQGTDPARTGLLEPFLGKRGSFEAYLNYVLDVPTFFIVREGEWIPLEGLPFRQFMDKGFGSYRAEMADFDLHLSTVFPECRLKKHIEIRGADAQAPDFIIAPCAFWKGILATSEVRLCALAEVEEFTWTELNTFYRELPRVGLSMLTGGRPAAEVVKKLFKLALFGLASSEQASGGGLRSEAAFLEPFVERFVYKGITPAEEIRKAWPSGEREAFPLALGRLFF